MATLRVKLSWDRSPSYDVEYQLVKVNITNNAALRPETRTEDHRVGHDESSKVIQVESPCTIAYYVRTVNHAGQGSDSQTMTRAINEESVLPVSANDLSLDVIDVISANLKVREAQVKKLPNKV